MPRISRIGLSPPLEYQAVRVALLILTGASLTGCMTWKPENVAPVQALKSPVPPNLRVTLVNGERRHLDSARVEQDSLVGIARAVPARWARDSKAGSVYVAAIPAGRTAFPLSQVARTEAHRVHTGRTLAVAVPSTAIVGFMVFLALWFGEGPQ